MKKETLVAVFYIIYFSWLLVVTFLNPITSTLNIFTFTVALFYLIFLRESEDMLFFFISACIPILFAVISFNNFQLKFDSSNLRFLPIWLPIAWGTTIVALKRFYNILTS
jgi:hypothetical protein